MIPELTSSCNRLLEALVNGGYQGLVLTGAVWLALKAFPRANAATRHMVWFVTLIIVALLPAAHFLLPGSGKASASPDWDAARTSVDGPGKTVGPGTEDGSGYALLLQEIGNLTREIWMQRFGEENTPLGLQETGSKDSPLVSKISPLQIDSKNASSPAWSVPIIPWSWRLSVPEPTSVALIGLWIVLASIRLGCLIWHFCRLHFLKARGLAAPASWRAAFERLSGEMGMRRRTHLLACPESRTPVAVGFRQPAVLLPVRMFGSVNPPQLEQVLLHELAHVSRRDDWTNFLQQSIKAVLFYHPAVWWLSRRLTVEREIACDDHVLAATRSPRAYALFLTEFAGQMQSRALPAALAAWSNKHQLEERITMILNSNRNSSPRLARARALVLSAAAAMVAILVLHAGPRLALAAEEPSAAKSAEVVAGTTEKQIDQAASAAVASVAEAAIQAKVEALEGLVAEIETAPEPPGGDAESGPRPKARAVPAAPRVAPGAGITPHPPGPPHVAHVAPPANPHVIAAVSAHPAPVATPSPRRSGDSIERRLQRLERLVEELLARDKEKAPKKLRDGAIDPQFNLKMPKIEIPKIEIPKIEIPKLNLEAEKLAKLGEQHKKLAEKMPKFIPNEEELARIKEHVDKGVQHAKREVDRAMKEVERAKAEAQHHARAKIEEHHAEHSEHQATARQGIQQQRQALESQRRSLERQMQALERQIQRLEERQQRAEEESADREKGPKKPAPNRDSDKSEDSDSKEKPTAR